jgi:hypothetical protein
MDDTHFIFFLDDFGTRTACKESETIPMWSNVYGFGLGGIIVPAEAVDEISAATHAFCKDWNVPVLHGNKIRGGRGRFAFLNNDEAKRDEFFRQLETILVDDRITAHACVICRPGYRDRYHKLRPEATRWDMSRTAFDISVERAAKFARKHGRQLSVVYERTGEAEDRLVEQYFARLKTSGTEFNQETSAAHAPLSQAELSETLRTIWQDGKGNPLLQLADLVLHPLCHHFTGLENRAYNRLVDTGQIIDARTDDPTIAVKYSCFDGKYKDWESPKGRP